MLNDLGYVPDVNGNRRTLTEQIAGTTLTTRYDYDPLQRLKQAIYPAISAGPTAQTIDYSLDAVGNRLNDPSTGAGQPVLSYNAADQQAGAPYDDNGNLLNAN